MRADRTITRDELLTISARIGGICEQPSAVVETLVGLIATRDVSKLTLRELVLLDHEARAAHGDSSLPSFSFLP